MRQPRKRKPPVTTTEGNHSASSHPHSTRTLIRRFHLLLKRRAALQTSESADPASLVEVEKELEILGGLSAYQRMSTIGQASDRGGGSEKRLIAWLKEIGLLQGTRRMQKLRCVYSLVCLLLSAHKYSNEMSADYWKLALSSRITSGRARRGLT
jgi:25S rRNA (adenine2142-N1)-methyltransferase